MKIKNTRIGLIIPSANIVIEPELYKAAPNEFSFHITRIPITKSRFSSIKKMNQSIEISLQMLLHAQVQLIIYACVSGSFVGGVKGESVIRKKIENISKKPTLTASMSIINTLKYFNFSKIMLVTPYPYNIHLLAKDFFEENKIEVLQDKTLNITDSIAIAETGTQKIYNISKTMNNKNIEALVISCTNLKTLDIITQLEEELQIPVITSTQSILWQVLYKFNYKGQFEKYGKIFEVFNK